MKKLMFLSLMLLLGTGMASAQSTAYTYVKQNDKYVSADGTAAFDVSDVTKTAVMSFDDEGNAIMTINGVTVAKLTAEERSIDNESASFAHGVLAADFDNQSGATAGSLSVKLDQKTADKKYCYATLYSPFQLQMPASSTVNVYTPTYVGNLLKCNSKTQIAADENVILPVCSSFILKYDGTKDEETVTFTLTASESTDSHTCDLSGYAVTMPLPTVAEGNKIYTLGHEDVDKTKFGFFRYVGEQMNPAKAYLVASAIGDSQPDNQESSTAKYIHFDFSEDASTSISNVETFTNANCDGKFIENGRVVIVKNGQKYNTIGQEVK